MIYWLLIFVFSPDGAYLDRIDIQTQSMEECKSLMESKENVSGNNMFHCVSDDHYNGMSVDAEIPLDFD